MADAFTEGHMQRPTDTLQNPDTKRQIESLFDASYLIEKGQYGQGGKLLLEILKSQNEQTPSSYSSFMLEVKFNTILTELYASKDYQISMSKLMENCITACEQLLEQIQKHEQVYNDQEDEENWQFADHLRIRIYTTLLQMSIKSGTGDVDDWLDEIIQLLKVRKNCLPEVIGKLCGCKDLKNFCLNFNSDQMLLNHDFLPPHHKKTPQQKAKLVEIASSWFIIAAQLQKGINLKKTAITLWKQANNLKEHDRCEMEYMELNSNSNSQFCITLKRLAKIVKTIQQSLDQTQKSTKEPPISMSLIVKKGLAKTIKQIEQFNDELDKIQDEFTKANKKKSVWSSSKKQTTLSTKKSLLNDSKLLDYHQKAHEFRTECYAKEESEEITSLIQNSSKFILEQKKTISKAVVPIVQFFTKRRKWAFLTLKNWYLVKYGMLNKDFLNSLGLNKLAQKKNPGSEKKLVTPQKDKSQDDSDIQYYQFGSFDNFAGTGKFASFKKN